MRASAWSMSALCSTTFWTTCAAATTFDRCWKRRSMAWPASAASTTSSLPSAGVPVTLVDDTPERIEGVQRIWREDLHLPVELVCIQPDAWGRLPFADRSFDLTWQWAGLWYIQDPAGLLRELARTSRNLVFVAMPNNLQVGYWMRKLVIDRDFFATHDESWTDIGRIRRVSGRCGRRNHRPGRARRAALARHRHARQRGAQAPGHPQPSSSRRSSPATAGSGARWPIIWASSPISTSGS